ncbi:MAG: hypothetical protein Q9184_005707 [Pyrenodesmia sp. 2 TL-2023]
MIKAFDETCFRYDGAYPVIENSKLQLPPAGLNFVACSGDKFPAILKNQFRDAPSSIGRPNWGKKPAFVTLSMGGNDIGFKELVTVCIYSLRIFTLKDCEAVIADSQRIVNSPGFINDAANVITTALAKGTDRSGPEFKVFVTGYAQFFNEDTPQCDKVSLKPRWSPFAAQYLTTERRRTMNLIARDLNTALRAAVLRARTTAPGRVLFVDYDSEFDGHRFCDRQEPNPNDPDTWFYTFGSDEATIGKFLNGIPQINGLLSGESNETMSDSEFLQLINQAANGDAAKEVDGVGAYRIFHPKPPGHQVIAEALNTAIMAARGPIPSGNPIKITATSPGGAPNGLIETS